MSGEPGEAAIAGRVLVVDDQPENLMLVEEVLTEQGFEVRLAADGVAALEEVEKEAPDCIVLDVMMPRLDGFGVCHKLKSHRDTHFIPICMLTALTSVEDKVRAFELGADDFLNKPVDIHELLVRVRSLIKIRRLRDELDTSENIIVSMVQALESKDPHSAGHSQRVAVLAAGLSTRLGISGEHLELITKGAVLHDLGKIGLPDHLLRGELLLSAEETVEYRQHAALGERILAPFLSFAGVRAVVRHHHERLDGSGYPDRLSGEEVDLATEIVALANYADLVHSSLPMAEAEAALELAARRGEFRRETVAALLDRRATGRFAEPSPRSWQDLLPLPGAVRPGKILLGDDVTANREFLRDVLTREGHTVTTVATAAEVLNGIEESMPDLVMVDVHGQGGDGFELCTAIKARPQTEFLPVILATADRTLLSRHGSAKALADDFLLLPVNRLELVARVKSLLRLRLFFRDLEEHQSVILSLASALEAKDPYTRGHSERVGVLAAQLARALGLPETECHLLMIAGQLHDIGKIGMPERVLNKEGKLDQAELRIVMEHPGLGERICQPLRTMRNVLSLIRHHHERLDGSGYPDGLKGDEISLGARILSAADAFDALTSARSYRQSFTPEDAISVLGQESRAGRWDPRVFATLAAHVRQGVGSPIP